MSAAVDIGSTAVRSAAGKGAAFAAEPHVFLDLPDDEGSRSLVERFELRPHAVEGRILIVGGEAVELASALGRAPKVCFELGLPASSNRLARAATRLLVERLLGPAEHPGESCFFEVPGGASPDSPGARMGALEIGSVVASLGYEPEPVPAAAAAAAALFGPSGSGLLLLAGHAFTHMALIVGGACAAVVSTTKAGRTIDREAADALGLDPERVRLLRERGVDLSEPQTREEEAIAVYVRATVAYLALTMREHAALIEIAAAEAGGALPVRLAGGFARTGGVESPVADELAMLGRVAELMPPEVAREPELAVLTGCVMMSADGEVE